MRRSCIQSDLMRPGLVVLHSGGWGPRLLETRKTVLYGVVIVILKVMMGKIRKYLET